MKAFYNPETKEIEMANDSYAEMLENDAEKEAQIEGEALSDFERGN